MRVIVAPDYFEAQPYSKQVIFMAGGITGCPDWQAEVIQKLACKEEVSGKDNDLVLLNPRRPEFDVRNVDEQSVMQIRWENLGLRVADAIYFWFPKEGKCMITLYELGYALGRKANIRVGCHPEYERAFDVHQQVGLADPSIHIYDNLDDLYDLG